MFIELRIDEPACHRAGPCRLCHEVCPVDVFALKGDKMIVLEENQDECTLCDLCLQRCPTRAITLVKLYERETVK
ncbi:MAG: 4Fe-4S binding protein [Chloroflexota bacterium]|nr:4Fe-4S binding protein [Chloroflexota bacterium]